MRGILCCIKLKFVLPFYEKKSFEVALTCNSCSEQNYSQYLLSLPHSFLDIKTITYMGCRSLGCPWGATLHTRNIHSSCELFYAFSWCLYTNQFVIAFWMDVRWKYLYLNKFLPCHLTWYVLTRLDITYQFWSNSTTFSGELNRVYNGAVT